jgi:hypothetical protein
LGPIRMLEQANPAVGDQTASTGAPGDLVVHRSVRPGTVNEPTLSAWLDGVP